MKTLKIILYTFISLIVIYTLAGFFLVPYIAKKEIIKNLDEILTTKTKIEKIYFNPLTLYIEVNNFALVDEEIDEYVVSFDNFSLQFAPFKSIEKRYLSIKNVSLDGIYANIVEKEKGIFNILQLLKNQDKELKNEEIEEVTKVEEESSSIQYLISKIVLKNAYIDYKSLVDEQKYALNLKDINYTIYDLGTYKNSLSSNNLEFILNENSFIKIGGGLKLDPFEAYGQINIKDLKIKEILDFDKTIFNFELNKEANLNLILNYNIELKNGFNMQLSSDLLDISNVKLHQNNKDIASLNNLDIKKVYFDLNAQTINLYDIFIKDLTAKMNLDKNGINFANLVNSSNTTNETNIDENIQPWIVNISNISLNNGNYSFTDNINNTNLSVKNINLNANKLNIVDSLVLLDSANLLTSNAKYQDNTNKFDVSSNKTNLKVTNIKVENSKTNIGNIAVLKDGFEFNENNSKIKLTSKNIDLNLSKLNIFDDISFDNAHLKTTNFNFQELNSKLSVSSKNINLKTNSFLFDKNQNISLKNSELSKTDINLFDASSNIQIDTNNSNLKLSNLNYKKDTLVIGEMQYKDPNIKMNNLESNLKIEAKNIDLNLKKIISKNTFFKIEKTALQNPHISIILPKTTQTKIEQNKEDDKGTNLENKKPFRFVLGPVDIKNMTFDFEDKNLPIPFKTTISKLNGTVSEVKNKANSTSNLEVKGVVDEYGIATITGVVNPNNIKILTDVNMKFKNIAMKSFTPYTAKFVGREIKDGKLELDLNYNITQSNLKAKNNILIKKIVLGEKIESPDAISLPLDLAIALLEDSSNTIDINLPVSGNVDDPQFSIGSIVWKAFLNLMTKAVTSPFSLIGSLFNFSEEEIKSVNFELNESEITPIQQETLDKIAIILKEKDEFAIKISATFNEKKEKESVGKKRVENIKEYLVKDKSINEKQVIIDSNIKKSNQNIDLNIEKIK
ncbi:DUF748 domain-containing protein [Aliarcobacter vitoriensis]|uniref:Uncharacterized protein n=1 Tax=Aliarcobacter vitoriensis TaxID=2011099 RepID=A0A366MWA9_9BACT|nr:DUF748 domain-containing protein [Aliarcobacter vitoriensis]RBQ29884.1 hypothetical protein CRU91_00995 [Aliarcobacter vitoriensis]